MLFRYDGVDITDLTTDETGRETADPTHYEGHRWLTTISWEGSPAGELPQELRNTDRPDLTEKMLADEAIDFVYFGFRENEAKHATIKVWDRNAFDAYEPNITMVMGRPEKLS